MQAKQDYFLQHLPKQPKREVCEYIYSELKGLSINHIKLHPAQIYSTRADAARAFNNPKSRKDIIIRTEDSQDYYRASGLRDSKDSSKFPDRLSFQRYFMGSEEETISKIRNSTSKRVSDYCNLACINQEEFDRGLSLSYWEHVHGVPVTISADSSIAGKYHVFLSKHRMTSYAVIEGGKISFLIKNALPEFALNAIQSLPLFYEEARNLGRFSCGHCYAMEAVIGERRFTPLQMLVVRDFVPPNFDLGGEGSPGIHAVRGATPNKDTIYTIVACFFDITNFKPTGIEDGFFFSSVEPALIEAYARETKLFLLEPDYDAQERWHAAHTTISQMLKPEVSIVLQSPFGNSFNDQSEMASMLAESRRTDKDIIAHFHVAADGKTAIVERV